MSDPGVWRCCDRSDECAWPLLGPVVWVFTALPTRLFRLFGLAAERDDRVTHGDILAHGGGRDRRPGCWPRGRTGDRERFELDTRTVESAMTIARPHRVLPAGRRGRDGSRAHCLRAALDLLRLRWRHRPVAGYVDATTCSAVLNNEPHRAQGRGSSLLQKVLRARPADALGGDQQFRPGTTTRRHVNEYSLVVGVITLNDVMSTVMGNLVASRDEDPRSCAATSAPG